MAPHHGAPLLAPTLIVRARSSGSPSALGTMRTSATDAVGGATLTQRRRLAGRLPQVTSGQVPSPRAPPPGSAGPPDGLDD